VQVVIGKLQSFVPMAAGGAVVDLVFGMASRMRSNPTSKNPSLKRKGPERGRRPGNGVEQRSAVCLFMEC
jgi:hypothetical protein